MYEMDLPTRLYYQYKKELRGANTALELLRLICKILLEIWWNMKK